MGLNDALSKVDGIRKKDNPAKLKKVGSEGMRDK